MMNIKIFGVRRINKYSAQMLDPNSSLSNLHPMRRFCLCLALFPIFVLISSCGVGVTEEAAPTPASPSEILENPVQEVQEDEEIVEPGTGLHYCMKDSGERIYGVRHLQKGTAPDYVWAEAKACLKGNLRSAYAILSDHAKIKWPEPQRIRVDVLQAPAPFAQILEVTYFYKHNWIAPTIDWTLKWFYEFRNSKLIVTYQRIRGTKYIPFWRGSLVIEQLDPETIGLSVVDQIRATDTDEQDSADSVMHLIGHLSKD
jgi:hypothetical protein